MDKEYQRVAKEAYHIFRGSLRGDDEKQFPHAWDGLPEHYRRLMVFIVSHASEIATMKPIR